MRRNLASIATAAMCTAANAGTFGVHIGSHHFPDAGMNNFNPGAYYTTDASITVGGYLNSHRKPSFYAAKVVHAGWVDVALGGVTGYPAAPIMPLVVPSIRFGSGLRLALVPKGHFNRAAVHAMWEF